MGQGDVGTWGQVGQGAKGQVGQGDMGMDGEGGHSDRWGRGTRGAGDNGSEGNTEVTWDDMETILKWHRGDRR